MKREDLPWLWVIVPTCRPARLGAVVELFRDQIYPKKRLLIVENGEAVGMTKALGIVAHAVTTSEKHPSHARNTGIDLVHDFGGGWLSMWDDDYYYGPQFLSELAFGIVHKLGDVLGKRRHFVSFQGRGLYLFNERNQYRRAIYPHGPTLCFHSREQDRYPIIPEAEEIALCDMLRNRGRSIFGLSIHHYCYRRGSENDHTFKGSPEKVAYISEANDRTYYLGHFSPDVINGGVHWRRRVKNVIGSTNIEPTPFVPHSARPQFKLGGDRLKLDLNLEYYG